MYEMPGKCPQLVAMVIQQQRCRHWLRLPNGKARMSHLGLLLAGMKVTVTMSTEWQPCAQPGWVNPSPSSHLLPVTPPKTSLPYLQPTDQERAFVSPPHSLWTRGGGGPNPGKLGETVSLPSAALPPPQTLRGSALWRSHFLPRFSDLVTVS